MRRSPSTASSEHLITDKVLLIAAGLGIGSPCPLPDGATAPAQDAQKYQYLEHGAPWAIGSLAVCLLATVRYEIP